MRYEIREETHKHGRKTETQWVVWDNLEDRVLVRYATRKKCQDLMDRWTAMQLAAENSQK